MTNGKGRTDQMKPDAGTNGKGTTSVVPLRLKEMRL